jgi:oxalate---CoA ligase
MKLPRAVICVENPWDYIPQLTNYSIMIVNPNTNINRINYLLDRADWSLLITAQGEKYRNGNSYDEKLFWYTSGTISDSKFYSFSQEQLDNLTTSIIKDYEITNNDRYVSVMGLWHAHGQSMYWASLKAGCETRFLSIKNIRDISFYQPTFTSAIPDILKIICNMPLKNLRFLRSGSSPLSINLYEQLRQKFKIPIVEYYGITEAMSHVLSNPLNGQQRPGTVGLPTTKVEAMIKKGQLWIRSKQSFTKEWFDTGDLAEQDEFGYYRILGRRVDQINVRGIKLNPVSLEKEILKYFPTVSECVIFGKDCVKCLYVGDIKKESIIQFLRSLVPHVRHRLIQSVDIIPIGPSGKISRSFLDKKFN